MPKPEGKSQQSGCISYIVPRNSYSVLENNCSVAQNNYSVLENEKCTCKRLTLQTDKAYISSYQRAKDVRQEMADMHCTGEESKGLTWLVWRKPPGSYHKKIPG
ncbi:MAG: hypothetical protein PHI48_08515 [Bacteroidales bacterium]|nr:hypothetical protein [Bacteroidales bacterium]